MTIQRQSSTEVGTEQRRLRLRDWLEMRIDDPKYPGLCWEDKEKRMFRIPWKHGARHGWREKEDARLFREWSQHTGATPRDVKQHKANFRCALNSLRDVEKVNSCNKNKGDDAYRLYRMLPKKSTKSTSRWIRKRGQRNIGCGKAAAANQNQHKTLPSAYPQQPALQTGFCPTLNEQAFTPYASSGNNAHFTATNNYPRPFVYPAGDFRCSAYGQLYSNQQQPAVNQTQREAYFNPYPSPEFASPSPISLTPSDSASGCFFADPSPNVSPLGVQGPPDAHDPEFVFTPTGVSDALGQVAAIQRDDGEAPFSGSPTYSWDGTQGVHSPTTQAMSFEQSPGTPSTPNTAPNHIPLSPEISPYPATPKTPPNPNIFTPNCTYGTSPIASDLLFKNTPNYPVLGGLSAPNLIPGASPHPTYVAPTPLPSSHQPQYGNSMNCNVQISHDFHHRSSINVAFTATNCCSPSKQQNFNTDSTTTGNSPDLMTSQPSGDFQQRWSTKSKSTQRGWFPDLSPTYGRCTSESYTEGSGFDSCGESEAKCEAFSENTDSVFMEDWSCDPPLTALYSGGSSHRMSGGEFTRLPSANTLLSSTDDSRVTSWLESTKYENHFSSLNPSEVYGK